MRVASKSTANRATRKASIRNPYLLKESPALVEDCSEALEGEVGKEKVNVRH